MIAKYEIEEHQRSGAGLASTPKRIKESVRIAQVAHSLANAT